MAKTFIYVKGKARWCRLVKPNQWDAWSIVLYPDPDSLEMIRELQAQGLKNTLKKDEDGYYIQFRRPINKVMRGKMVAFEAPHVTDANGVPMDGSVVGNDSDVTIQLDVYEHGTPGGGKAKAARLEAVRVDNLVKFTAEEDFPEGEQRDNAIALRDQPKPVWD